MRNSVRRMRQLLASIGFLGTTTAAWAQTIDVYKLGNCGCCEKWVEHLRGNRFTPQVYDMHDLDSIKQRVASIAQWRPQKTKAE